MGGFYARFDKVAERFRDRTAVEVQHREGLEVFSYRRLRSMAESAARFLEKRGIRAGDRCALLADNDAHWCAAYLGLLRLGAVAVPLDTSYTSYQIGRLLEDSEAGIILSAPRFLEEVERARREVGGACRSFVLHGGDQGAAASPIDAESLFASDPPEGDEGASSPPPAVGSDDPAVILYTSGTTSDPKGVVLTHGNLLGEIDAALSVISVTEDDAVLGVLPLFHALAQMANLLLPMSVGARVVFLETVNTGELMRALHERDITAFCCVPQFFYLIHERVLEEIGRAGRLRRLVFRLLLWIAGSLRERLGVNLGRAVFARVHRALGARMRLLVTGGSRFDPRVGRDLYRLGFNILQAYGLTETSGAATVLRPGDRHVDSVGPALPGVELKIVPYDPAEDGVEEDGDADRRIGEIAIRGPVVSPGYFRRPEVNAATFRDGWLHTGDLGHLDSTGRLYITGRAKEMIVLGSGKNIYPEEIEAHYLQSPYIKELCVMGRARSDAPSAERLHAVIVPDFDLLRERKIVNAREILRFEIEELSTRLPNHKRILSYDIVIDDLPRTTTRKLKRFEIERRLGQPSAPGAGAFDESPPAESAEDSAWAADPHVSHAMKIVSSAARGRGGIRPSANLELDLGLDSMERVELLAALEARFGVAVPDEVAHRVHTVRELVDAVRPAGSASAIETAQEFDPWRHILDELPEDDRDAAGFLAPRPLLGPVLFVGAKLLYALAWLLIGLRVSGREHLPHRGPFLISPNHQSFLDAFLLVGTLPYRVFTDMFFVGASEYFETPFRARIARLIHVVPVDPDTHLVHAMRAGARGLRDGKILILFPEGERSIDGEIKIFKKGAAILALNVGAPIVPVAIDGAFEVWPRGRRPRFSKMLPLFGARTRIRFGPPLIPTDKERCTEDDYATLTERLRRDVGEMIEARP